MIMHRSGELGSFLEGKKFRLVYGDQSEDERQMRRQVARRIWAFGGIVVDENDPDDDPDFIIHSPLMPMASNDVIMICQNTE